MRRVWKRERERKEEKSTRAPFYVKFGVAPNSGVMGNEQRRMSELGYDAWL